MRPPLRKTIGAVLWVPVVLVLLALLAWQYGQVFLGPTWEDYSHRLPFDSAAWKHPESDDNLFPPRLRMVDDLLRRHPLVGKTRGEIDTLLGPPTDTPYFQDYDYVYWLGPERGLIRIDSGWLAIKFDGEVVTTACILRD